MTKIAPANIFMLLLIFVVVIAWQFDRRSLQNAHAEHVRQSFAPTRRQAFPPAIEAFDFDVRHLLAIEEFADDYLNLISLYKLRDSSNHEALVEVSTRIVMARLECSSADDLRERFLDFGFDFDVVTNVQSPNHHDFASFIQRAMKEGEK